MVRPVLGLAAAGILGFFLWKLAGLLLFPLLGLVFFVLKIAFIIAVVYFVVRFFRKGDKGETKEAPAD